MGDRIWVPATFEHEPDKPEPKHPPIKPCAVRILDRKTGEVRTYTDECGWHDENTEPSGAGDYIWRDGNWSCDSNRKDMFREAGGEEEIDDEDDSDHCCTDPDFPDGRFVVLDITAPNGEILYCEDDPR